MNPRKGIDLFSSAEKKLPSVLVSGLVIAGAWVGVRQVERFPLLLDIGQPGMLRENVRQIQETIPLFNPRAFLLVWWQNSRTLLLSMVLGAFSFGVIGVLPLMVTVGISGYLLGALAVLGLDPVLLISGLILPHGVFEIPAAILATAAVLHTGATLATPNSQHSIGEIWITALADWAKVILGVVLPLMLIAAAVEVWVTPRIALLIF